MLPIEVIADGGGPINLTPFFTHYCAKLAFSDRKPKPGWSASQLESFAISSILALFRYD